VKQTNVNIRDTKKVCLVCQTNPGLGGKQEKVFQNHHRTYQSCQAVICPTGTGGSLASSYAVWVIEIAPVFNFRRFAEIFDLAAGWSRRFEVMEKISSDTKVIFTAARGGPTAHGCASVMAACVSLLLECEYLEYELACLAMQYCNGDKTLGPNKFGNVMRQTRCPLDCSCPTVLP